MWIQDQHSETLHWKYGTIIIKKYPYFIDQNTITLLSSPFYPDNNNTLSIDTHTQQAKNIKTVQNILTFLNKMKAVRSSKVVIKGGGLLLDVGGFACAIYMRGLEDITYVPTTLLAMVDATVGGKTGINFADAKNIVGVVKHPKRIIIDLSTLDTLSDREFNNGFAEVIKMAVTYDPVFFQRLIHLDLSKLRTDSMKQQLKYIIKRSLQLKIDVVEKDQFEKHQRKWLNYGHTFGHGIELAQNNTFLHGECVSIGMIKALELSQHLGILQDNKIKIKLQKILKKLSLPTQIPDKISKTEIVQLMLKDKKKTQRNTQIQFVFLSDIGKPCDHPTPIQKQTLLNYISNQVEIGTISSLNQSINRQFTFPSSKSISLRLAYMSALSLLKFGKPTKINNFLTSEDTACMLDCLTQLGFKIKYSLIDRTLQMISYQHKKSGKLNIGNSGVTARLILPLCSTIEGEWNIVCHPRMEERPNKQIIKLCQQHFKCSITFQKNDYCFPLIVKTNRTCLQLASDSIEIDGTDSSQFITSFMIFGGFFSNNLSIITQAGTLVSQSYLIMTARCLQLSGITTKFQQSRIKIESKDIHSLQNLMVETDLSSLSYPYIFSLLNHIEPPQLPTQSIQGDLLFYKYINQLLSTQQKHVCLDFNNCTDTFMTMAVFAVASAPKNIQTLTIYNIANQRVKESDRIDLTICNLKKVGINVEQYENQIKIIINGHIGIPQNSTIVFETANDHRLAMSMAILSTQLKKHHPTVHFIIDDKKAVQKTFPKFWKYLAQAGVHMSAPTTHMNPLTSQFCVSNSIILIGDRGCGKTTIGQYLSVHLNYPFIDLDDQIQKELTQTFGVNSISEFVQKQGWKKFRQIEQKVLQEVLGSKRIDKFVLATGAGVVESQRNCQTLARDNSQKIYIQRHYQHLRIEQTHHRPLIPNYKEVSQIRKPKYQRIATQILYIPQQMEKESEGSFVLKNTKQMMNQGQNKLKEGILLCLDQIPKKIQELSIDPSDISAVQFRIDQLLQTGQSLAVIRQQIAEFKCNNTIDTILTLRSKVEYGSFEGNYLKTIKQICKIPTNLLDHQFVHPFNYNYNPSKVILSYHGQNTQIINNLINLNNFKGIKKLCFKDTQQKWRDYYNKLGQNSICIDLSNPITRIANKYQFVTKNELPHNKTGIFSIQQMKTLNKVKGLIFRK